MSDLDAATPRVFLVRHGETEWTKTGQYTGKSDLELTAEGVRQVTSTASQLVGSGKLIDPAANVLHIFVSPRKRAQQTFDCMFGGDETAASSIAKCTTVTEDIAEWSYGDYEGLRTAEIKALRSERGLDQEKPWDIWRDGCEGGESAEQVTTRLDRLISEIRELQRDRFNGKTPADVVLVAHGHILRAFTKRWLRYSLEVPLPMMMSPGAVAVLSYKNRNIDEPGFYIGMSLPPQN